MKFFLTIEQRKRICEALEHKAKTLQKDYEATKLKAMPAPSVADLVDEETQQLYHLAKLFQPEDWE